MHSTACLALFHGFWLVQTVGRSERMSLYPYPRRAWLALILLRVYDCDARVGDGFEGAQDQLPDFGRIWSCTNTTLQHHLGYVHPQPNS